MFSPLDRFVYSLDPWVVGVIALVLLVLAVEGGYWFGRWRRARTGESEKSQITTLQAAILGFLALILGFSFSESQSRFDTRRVLAVDEANAIGTTYLRAQMLPRPYRARTKALLVDYTDTRLPRPTPAAIERDVSRARRLHDELWAQVNAMSRADVNPAVLATYTIALNETIDLHTRRVAAFMYRAPGGLIVLLHVAALLAMGVMGYASGLQGRRNMTALLVMVALVALVLFLIADLEHTTKGVIQVNPEALIDLKKTLDTAGQR